jgi:acyl-CoA synthetase (AMP-forming)/AMP-acid ligase II/3-oxoacyl-(acyl-carrier-protein) synthase
MHVALESRPSLRELAARDPTLPRPRRAPPALEFAASHGLALSHAQLLMMHPPTLIEVLERRVRLEPEALTFDGRSLADLRASALRVATGLRERGFAGRAVLVAAPAGVEYVECLLGCLYAGAIMVPAYPPTPTRLSRASQRIRSIAGDAQVGCALLACDAALEPALGVESMQLAQLQAEHSREPVFDWELSADQPCLLQYTSGSTAEPKGVAISLRQLSANLVDIQRATGLGASDVLVTWLPPYHDMGLIGGIFWPLYTGVATTLIAPDAFIRSPARWLQAISEQRATATMAPNFAFDLCVRRIPEARRAELDLSSLRVVCNGAEPIRAATLDAFARAFAPSGFDSRAFYPCYGLAEATLFVTGRGPDRPTSIAAFESRALERHRAIRADIGPWSTPLVSCGRPSGTTRLRIVDPTTRSALPEGHVGEIWIAGESVGLGYWNRPSETQASFQAQLSDSSEGPFLRSGDLGFVLDGELFVTGRLKELIIVRGQNHYPQDIEHTLQTVHPALAATVGAVFGIEADGEEHLVAIQEFDQRPGPQTREASDLLSAMIEAVRQQHGLGLYACLLVKRGTVERTASGKVRRAAMREAFLAGSIEPLARWDRHVAVGVPASEASSKLRGSASRRAAIANFLCARIARHTGLSIDAVDEHAPLARYGIDSLNAAELTHELELFLGMSLPATISFDRPTIAALADALCASEQSAGHTARAPARQVLATEHAAEPLAIIGMSCRFPGAPNLDAFWRLLERGEDAVSELPTERWQLAADAAPRFGGFIDDIAGFDPAFFGVSAREAARMDPQQRLFLELAWAALEDAGIPPSSLRQLESGVFAGVCSSDYALLHAGQLALVDADYGCGNAPSVVANRVSYTLDLRGPSLTVDTACSSALVALHLASQSLRSGESSVAIVGGVNAVLAPEPAVFFSKARALARDGRCKAFDTRADGFVRSEGCGVIVLKRLCDAEAAGDRIYALVRGSAVNHDGTSNGLMAPNGPAQERLLRSAFARAGITPDQLDYLEAHGVGTPLSDAVELAAVSGVLRGRSADRPCWIGSVKTNLGHLEAAAGIASLIKTALSLMRERIPAHLHLRVPAVRLDPALAIPTESIDWPRSARERFAGVSAFGFGGTNAHVVLSESPRRSEPPRARSARRPRQLLALSAKHPAALQQLARQLLPHVTADSFEALCFSLNTGRDHFAHRAALLASDPAELCASLSLLAAGPDRPARPARPRLALVFSERLPDAGAARELAAIEPEFRRALERGAQAAGAILDSDPLPALLAQAAPKIRPLRAIDAQQPWIEFPQTCAVLMHYALYSLLQQWGVAASAAYGCGMGEYSAACAAGVLDWLDALRLCARRELLLGSLVPGGRIRQTLHQFKTALGQACYAPPRLPLIAASLGAEPEHTLDRVHWLEHLYARTAPLRGLSSLRRLSPELYLDLGPLDSAAAVSSMGIAHGDWLACAGDEGLAHTRLFETLASLYERGVALDFRAFHAGFECDRIALPSYPFQHQRCWLEFTRPQPPTSAPSLHPFLGSENSA